MTLLLAFDDLFSLQIVGNDQARNTMNIDEKIVAAMESKPTELVSPPTSSDAVIDLVSSDDKTDSTSSG